MDLFTEGCSPARQKVGFSATDDAQLDIDEDESDIRASESVLDRTDKASIVPTRKNDDEKIKMKSSMEMERLTSEAVENGVEHRFVN